jgi:hypothetical protein
MTKIPVGKTVVSAYAFTFNNLGAIIGLIWIPMLAVTLIGFFAQSTYVDGMLAYSASKNAADLGPGFMWMLLFIFVALLGNAIMLVPVLQQAMGTRQGQVLYHFALGPPEWRMFGAYLALAAVVLALAIVAALLNGAATTIASMMASKASLSPAMAVAGLSLIRFAVFVLFLVVVVRLAFFIPAITMIEEKIDLSRGWNLANGNALRLLAVVLLAGIPVVVLYFGIEVALFGPQAVFPEMTGTQAGAGPTVDQIRASREQMPLTEALGFFLAPLTVGINAGVVVAAYRALIAPVAAPTTE